MSDVKLVAIFSENKLGQLARITKLLAEARINIRWVTIATSETFGVIKFLLDQNDAAFAALKKKKYTVSLIDVLAIEVQDQPGGLHAVVACLAKSKINVANSSGFVSNGRAVLLIETTDVVHARQTLEKQHLHLLTQEEVMNL
jgi:hypothetical protein